MLAHICLQAKHHANEALNDKGLVKFDMIKGNNGILYTFNLRIFIFALLTSRYISKVDIGNFNKLLIF